MPKFIVNLDIAIEAESWGEVVDAVGETMRPATKTYGAGPFTDWMYVAAMQQEVDEWPEWVEEGE